MNDPIYQTKDGQRVTKSQLIQSGYSDDRISKGLTNGILTLVGDTNEKSDTYVTKDGQTVTKDDLINSGYSEERISKGLENGILTVKGAEVKKKETVSQPVSNEQPVGSTQPSNDISTFQSNGTSQLGSVVEDATNLIKKVALAPPTATSNETGPVNLDVSTLDRDIDRQYDFSLSRPEKPKDKFSLNNAYYNDRLKEFNTAKEVAKTTIKKDKQSLSEYNVKRIGEINGEVSAHNNELKELNSSMTAEPQNSAETKEYVKKFERITELKRLIASASDYKEKLKGAVASESVNKIVPNYIATGQQFDPVALGREILQVGDPEKELQYQDAEKLGVGLPPIQRASMERLGLDAAKSYLRQQPQTEEVAARLGEIDKYEKDFDEKNYELTAQRVREKLAVYFYNDGKSGVFGYKTKDIEKAINDPATNLTDIEKKVGLEYVLPTERRLFLSTEIPGSGFFRAGKNSIERSVQGLGNTISGQIGDRSDSDRAYENLNNEVEQSRFRAPGESPSIQSEIYYLNKKEAESGLTETEKKKKVELEKLVDVRGNWQMFRDGVGDLTGQVVQMALLTKGLGAAGRLATAVSEGGGILTGGMTTSAIGTALSNETVGLFLNSYFQSYDSYRSQALELMPGEKNAANRQAYATVMSAMEGFSEKIFNDVKVLDAFTKGIAPSVADITNKFINKEITQEVARRELSSAFAKYAKPFGKEYFKSTYQESFEEGIVDLADGIAQSIFGGQDFDINKTGDQAIKTFLTTALYSPLVAGMAAHGATNQSASETAFYKSAIVNMAANPTPYLKSVEELKLNGTITQDQANEKIQLITSAQKYLGELPKTVVTKNPSKKGAPFILRQLDFPEISSYITHRLNEGILSDELEKAKGDPVLSENIQSQIDRSVEIRKGILDGKIAVSNNIVDVTDDEKKAEELGISHTNELDPDDLAGTKLYPIDLSLTPEEVIVDAAKKGNLEGTYGEMVQKDPATAKEVLLDLAKQKYGIQEDGTESPEGGRDISMKTSLDVDEAVEKVYPDKESVISAINNNKTQQNAKEVSNTGETKSTEGQAQSAEKSVNGVPESTRVQQVDENGQAQVLTPAGAVVENATAPVTDFSHPKWDGKELWERPYMGGSENERVANPGVSEEGELVRSFDPGALQKRMIEDYLGRGEYEKAIKEGRMTASDAKTIIESVGAEVPQDILIDAGVEAAKSQPVKPKVRVTADQLKSAQPVKEVVPEKPVKPKSNRQEKINSLRDRVDSFNKMASNANNKAAALNELRLDAEDLKLTIDYGKGHAILRYEGGGKVQRRSAVTNAKVAKNFDASKYSQTTQDAVNRIVSDPSLLQGMALKGEDGYRLSDAQRESAIQSIKDGRLTEGGKALYDFFENAKNGNIVLEDLVTGQELEVPIAEYFTAMESVQPVTDEDINSLNSKLGEENFNDLFDEIFDDNINNQNEPENIPAERVNPPGKVEQATPSNAEQNKEAVGDTRGATDANEKAKKTPVSKVSKLSQKLKGKLSAKEMPDDETTGDENNERPLFQIRSGAILPDQVVTDFIREELNNKTDEGEIRQALVDNGYSEQAARELIEDTRDERQITLGVIGQVGQWLGKLFGGKQNIFIAKDEKSLLSKAAALRKEGGKQVYLFKEAVIGAITMLTPMKVNESKSIRIEQTTPTAKSKDEQAVIDIIDRYYKENDEKAPKEVVDRVLYLWDIFGRPEILGDSTSKDERAYVNYDGKKIKIGNITNFDDLVAELAHSAQYVSGKKMDNREYVSQEERDRLEYDRKGSMEYKAHKEIEPILANYIFTGDSSKLNKIQYQKKGGTVLGFTHNGKIYLNGQLLNPETPIHEASHVWSEWAKDSATDLYDRGRELIKNSQYLIQVKASPFYQSEAKKLPVGEREAYFEHEALATAIGDKGAKFISDAKKKGFTAWAKELWDRIGKALGFKDILPEELANLTLDEFAQRAAIDILKADVTPRASTRVNKDDVVEVAKEIRADRLTRTEAIVGKDEKFIEALDKELYGTKRFNLDQDAFREQVRKMRDFGTTKEDVIANFASAKKITKKMQEIIDDVFLENEATNKAFEELKEAIRSIAKGFKPKKVLQRLAASDVKSLVRALHDRMAYKPLSNKQMEDVVDYILETVDLDDIPSYLATMHYNGLADVVQLLRAKAVVELQKTGNNSMARELIADMADDAVSAGRQTQSLRRAYEILNAKGNPAMRTAFAKRFADKVQETARKMNQRLTQVISDKQAEIGKLNQKIHSQVQQSPGLLEKLKNILNKICGVRTKK